VPLLNIPSYLPHLFSTLASASLSLLPTSQLLHWQWSLFACLWT